MDELHKDFIDEAAHQLSNLIDLLSREKNFSPADRQAILRTLHTIKGTAQVFGLENAGSAAHSIESQIISNGFSHDLISELNGLKRLLHSEETANYELHRKTVISRAQTGENIFHIPAEYFSALSEPEKENLTSKSNSNSVAEIFRAEVELSGFSAKLSEKRSLLETFSDVVAVFPSSKASAAGKIAFDFLIVRDGANPSASSINIYDTFQLIFSSDNADLVHLLDRLKEYGLKAAARKGKNVKVEISGDLGPIPDSLIKILFVSLMHLIRNSIDHAFTESGRIDIDFSREKGGLTVNFSDNGRGIDPVKLDGGSEGAEPSTSRFERIFEPGFSTAEFLSETSGRGVGLDAVRSAVTSVGGRVSVESSTGNGTAFSIVLPIR